MIKKLLMFLKPRLDMNGCVVFVLPKELSKEINRDGYFQMEIEEIQKWEAKYNKVVVIKS